MRVVLPLLALVLTTGASAPPSEPPVKSDRFILRAPAQPGNCRETIQLAREERGLPQLERGDASSEEPLLIAAVEKRIGGCSVLVMHGNVNDIRPLPEVDGQARLRRIQ